MSNMFECVHGKLYVNCVQCHPELSPSSSDSESPERRLLRKVLSVGLDDGLTVKQARKAADLFDEINALLARPGGQNNAAGQDGTLRVADESSQPSASTLPVATGRETPVPAAPSEKLQPSATPRADALYRVCGKCGMGFVLEEDAERLEQELAQACLERNAARNVLARAIERERLANMRATEWEEAAEAAQSAREATAWIVTDRHGDVLHFSKADGWKVAVVQEGEAQSVTAPLEVLDRCLSELANRYVGTVEDYYIHGLYRAREEIKRLRRTDNCKAQEGKDG
jgi:hypothetical protein